MDETAVRFILEALKKFTEIVPYNDFRDLSANVCAQFHLPIAQTDLLISMLARGLNLQLGMPEGTYEGQKAALNFSKSRPGSTAEPIRKMALSKEEELPPCVRVEPDDQAPWGAGFVGVIKHINKDNTFDIIDIKTNELCTNINPKRVKGNPLARGREDLRVQQRRVGDPPGLGESHTDVGGNFKREYPNSQWMPSGQADKDIKNPQSAFYKEANDDSGV
jgi:hypothetical protein